ncbi:hypothetical protein ACFL59_15640, partial [Planctomycetota bacterium]
MVKMYQQIGDPTVEQVATKLRVKLPRLLSMLQDKQKTYEVGGTWYVPADVAKRISKRRRSEVEVERIIGRVSELEEVLETVGDALMQRFSSALGTDRALTDSRLDSMSERFDTLRDQLQALSSSIVPTKSEGFGAATDDLAERIARLEVTLEALADFSEARGVEMIEALDRDRAAHADRFDAFSERLTEVRKGIAQLANAAPAPCSCDAEALSGAVVTALGAGDLGHRVLGLEGRLEALEQGIAAHLQATEGRIGKSVSFLREKLEALEQGIGAQLQGSESRVFESISSLHGKLDALPEGVGTDLQGARDRVLESVSSLGGKLDTLSEDVGRQLQEPRDRVLESVSSLHGKLDALPEGIGAQLQGPQDQVCEALAALGEKLGTLEQVVETQLKGSEDLVSEPISAVREQLENLEREITVRLRGSENRVSDSVSSLHGKLEVLPRGIGAHLQGTEDRVSESVSSLREQLEALERGIGVELQDTGNRVSESVTSLHGKLDALPGGIGTHLQGTEERVSESVFSLREQLDAVEQGIGTQLQDTEDRVYGSLSSLDEKLATLDHGLLAQQHGNGELIGESVAEIRDKADASLEGLRALLCSAQDQEKRTDQLLSLVQQGLEESLPSAVAHLDDLRAELHLLSGRVEDASVDSATGIDTRLSELTEQLGARLEETARLAEALQSHQRGEEAVTERLAKLAGRIDDRVTAALGTMTKRTNSLKAAPARRPKATAKGMFPAGKQKNRNVMAGRGAANTQGDPQTATTIMAAPSTDTGVPPIPELVEPTED